jgi:SLOG cluster3 family
MVSAHLETRYFLSASIPDPRRNPIYHDTADLTAIREAITAVAAVALKRGQLVFGGHPAISPLVLIVANSLDATDRVRIFQSEFFRDQIPPESQAFKHIVWTQRVGSDRDASLLVMRRAMIEADNFAAAFFVGGMEGVEEEFKLFRARWPMVPAFPVASTGAAARLLLERERLQLPSLSADRVSDLKTDFVYSALFERLLDA